MFLQLVVEVEMSNTADKVLGITPGKKALACFAICFCHFALMGSINITGALGSRLMAEFGISVAELGGLQSISFLTGCLFGIPFGIFADKTKVTTAIGIGMAIGAIGALMRALVYAYTESYVLLYIANFILGFGLAGLNANSVKFLGAWFGVKVGTPMGIYVACAAIGTIAAIQSLQFIPTTVGTWFMLAAVIIVATIVWFIIARIPEGVKVQQDNLHVKDFIRVGKNPWVWVAAIAMAFAMGANTVLAAQMAATMIQAKGVDEVFANNMLTVNSITMMLSCIFVPGLIQRAKNKQLAVVLGFGVLGLLICITGWFFPDATIGCLILGCSGLAVGGIVPPCKSIMAQLRFNIENAGTMGAAGGIQCFVQNLGGWGIPILIGMCVFTTSNGVDYAPMWIVTGVVFLLATLLMFIIPKRQVVLPGTEEEAELLSRTEN